jgi:hypothetical protein
MRGQRSRSSSQPSHSVSELYPGDLIPALGSIDEDGAVFDDADVSLLTSALLSPRVKRSSVAQFGASETPADSQDTGVLPRIRSMSCL